MGFLAHSLKANLLCNSLTLTVKDMTFFWFSIFILPAATELHSLPDKLSSSFILCPLLNSFINEAKNPKEITKSLETPCNITSFGSDICQCTSNLKVCMLFKVCKILPVKKSFHNCTSTYWQFWWEYPLQNLITKDRETSKIFNS